MRTAVRTEKDFQKSGQDRAIPASVATALLNDIKHFLDEEAPLMILMSSPGIKKVQEALSIYAGVQWPDFYNI